MKTVTLKERHDKKYKDGYLVVEESDVFDMDNLNEGDLFILKNASEEELGLFYFGRQNRGIGYKVSNDLSVRLTQNYFTDLMKKARLEREPLYRAGHTNAFRIYNGEGDGLGGFTVDNYNGHLLIQWYSKGIYRYQQEVLTALKSVFNYESIYEKLRFEKEVPTYLLTDTPTEFPIIIEENNLFYTINFEDGPMTGIFLDQRDVRNKILSLPLEEGTMLNLFAYSGGFSVAAAKNGMDTTSVDIAKRSLELIEQNFALNELTLDNHFRYTLDVFDMFKYCRRKNLLYDLIVIDPPSFSRSKKRRFSVKSNYHELIEEAAFLTKANGYLLCSTNASDYTLNAFKKMIESTLENQTRDFEFVEVMGLPKDFKTTNLYKPSKYLKVVLIKFLD
ncbi:class I SAM-dependent rRNA methyltransferase [Macrococcus lamae]|uniref:Class I SAM-dependent rRNA methyltransferase n=1 Tax=Macrococcus lamae TaxID=198484 RepID=A0A4R6BVM9_9STAP|nr:class I SAM-dependent rRNA methyltransferase [Macrococcus lamae]TDM12364.1 class I SAM-dependent rRNA methyltransferase [Macrococcus lamae]